MAIVFGFRSFRSIRPRGCSVGCWIRALGVEIAVIRDLATGVSFGFFISLPTFSRLQRMPHDRVFANILTEPNESHAYPFRWISKA